MHNLHKEGTFTNNLVMLFYEMHGGKSNQLNNWYISQAGKEDVFERDTSINANIRI